MVMSYSTAAQASAAVGKPKAHICRASGQKDVEWKGRGMLLVTAR